MYTRLLRYLTSATSTSTQKCHHHYRQCCHRQIVLNTNILLTTPSRRRYTSNHSKADAPSVHEVSDGRVRSIFGTELDAGCEEGDDDAIDVDIWSVGSPRLGGASSEGTANAPSARSTIASQSSTQEAIPDSSTGLYQGSDPTRSSLTSPNSVQIPHQTQSFLHGISPGRLNAARRSKPSFPAHPPLSEADVFDAFSEIFASPSSPREPKSPLVRTNPRVILPVPPEAPAEPCHILTDKEVDHYLKPLYIRRWYVGRRTDENGEDVLFLAKHAALKTEGHATKLSIEIARACLREALGTKFSVKADGANLTFTTYSDPAIRPDGLDMHIDDRTQPGITLRDVRLALMVEPLWNLELRRDNVVRQPLLTGSLLATRNPTSLLTPANSRSHPPAEPNPSHPENSVLSKNTKAEKTEKKSRMRCFICRGPHHARDCPDKKKFKEQITCSACKGFHHVRDCPNRASYKPKSPCAICGSMDHWTQDCQAVRADHAKGQFRTFQCHICRGLHRTTDCPKRQEYKPPKACPACGGADHWVFDCPSSEAKSKFQWRICSYCGGTHWMQDCRRLRAKREKEHQNADVDGTGIRLQNEVQNTYDGAHSENRPVYATP